MASLGSDAVYVIWWHRLLTRSGYFGERELQRLRHLERWEEGHPTASGSGVATEDAGSHTPYGVTPAESTCWRSGAIDTKMSTSPPCASEAMHRKVRKPLLP